MIVVLIVFLLLLGRGIWSISEKAAIARAERAHVAETAEELAVRIAEIEKSLGQLGSPRGIDQEIRGRYMVARPEEEVVVIVDDGPKKSENSEAAPQSGFWGRVQSIFSP